MPPIMQLHEVSPIQSQNQMRLRVNRVALLQTMKAEYVLDYLRDKDVITEAEQEEILSGTTQQDKVKILLNLLPTKGKSVDWYRHFRESLKNPAVRSKEIKKKYQILVEFLDNTIIHPPPKTVSTVDLSVISGEQSKSLSKFDPLPGIGGREDARGGEFTYSVEAPSPAAEQTATRPYSSRSRKPWVPVEVSIPNDFKSTVKKPRVHFQTLAESGEPADKEQLEIEESVLDKMKQLEAVFSIYMAGDLPGGVELCMTSVVEDMLMDWKNHHIYFKYMDELEFSGATSTCIVKQLAASMISHMQKLGNAVDEELTEHVVKMAFRLTDFMRGYGMYYHAEAVIIALMSYLKTNPVLENWMAIYEGFIKIMELRNTNLDFPGVEWAYNAAQNMAGNIKMMSFGKDLHNESEMYLQLNKMLLEQGSITPAFHWAQTSIREVNKSDPEAVINTLCSAASAYSMKWHLKKAQQLAVYAVQYARLCFGTNHPLYVKALLDLSRYLTDFWRDPIAIEISKEALELATKVYGGATVQVAEAHEVLARAMAYNGKLKNGHYLEHAKKALRVAMDVLPTEHPRLAPFRHTLAECLLIEVDQCKSEDTQSYLLQADVEAGSAAQAYNQFWGTYSLKTAQILVLMAEIYQRMDRLADAEQALLNANGTLVLSMPARSPHIYLVSVALARYYNKCDKTDVAIKLYKDVVENADTAGVYQEWINNAYKSLIQLLEDEEEEEEAERYHQQYKKWKKNHRDLKQIVTWELLHEKPEKYNDFLANFDIWKDKVNKLKTGIHDLYLDKVQMDT